MDRERCAQILLPVADGGRWDRRRRVGGGLPARSASLAIIVFVKVPRATLHHAAHGPPPPALRGRMGPRNHDPRRRPRCRGAAAASPCRLPDARHPRAAALDHAGRHHPSPTRARVWRCTTCAPGPKATTSAISIRMPRRGPARRTPKPISTSVSARSFSSPTSGPSMLFGTRRAFRSVAGAEALTMLGWRGVGRGGRVGLLAATARGTKYSRQGRGRAGDDRPRRRAGGRPSRGARRRHAARSAAGRPTGDGGAPSPRPAPASSSPPRSTIQARISTTWCCASRVATTWCSCWWRTSSSARRRAGDYPFTTAEGAERLDAHLRARHRASRRRTASPLCASSARKRRGSRRPLPAESSLQMLEQVDG